MAIDLQLETPLSLSAATKEKSLTLDGRRIHLSSVWRWCRKGLRGTYLEYARVGNRIVTSREALSRFFARLAEADAVESSPLEHPASRREADTLTRSEKRREQDIARSRDRLAKVGI